MPASAATLVVAPLPHGLELATVYTAGVCARAALPEQARALASLLAGAGARAARQRTGFVQATSAQE